KKDSLNFIICKATEGITYTDPKFRFNWKMIKEKGFVRGAYHFYRSQDNPIAQAGNYLKAIENIEESDLPPIIDFEGGGIDKTIPIDKVKSTLLVFLNKIEESSNRIPIIYTNINIGNLYLNSNEFAKYPLWIANYTNNKKPNLPITWKKNGWVFWQKSESYVIDDITDDFDVFNGNITELKKFIASSFN
ncbi:GH25 family lysozyme, partial [Tenacibaculum sp.]|nr:GH25 family lysozyme [Tenacibaculum sp.]